MYLSTPKLKLSKRLKGQSFKRSFQLREASTVGWDCLLDGIHVPDMELSHRPARSLRERLSWEEPDVFDREVDDETYRSWVRGF